MSNTLSWDDNTFNHLKTDDKISLNDNMAANNKKRYWQSSRMVQLVMGVVLLLTMPVAYAQNEMTQCFSDVQAAYDYLIAQEQSDREALKQSRTNTVVNINSATEAELTRLTGIGSSKAQAIIRHRNTFGNFTDIDGLMAVKGIGKKTVENNRARLTVSPY